MKIEWKRSMFIPKDARLVALDNAPAGVEVYYYEHNAHPCAITFQGKAQKPAFHERYFTEAQREKRITDWLEGLRGWANMKAEHKDKTRSEFANIKVGDILHTSWGYDQTNVDWYQVVSRTAGTITVRKIAGNTTDTGFMCGDTTPCPNRFVGPPELRQSLHGGDHSWRNLYKWNGTPHYVSWYA